MSEGPPAPEDIPDTMGRYFFHLCDSLEYHPDNCVVDYDSR